MGSLVDAKWAALSAYPGAMSDKTLAWLQANGATSSAVSDAWREMLVAKGVNPDRNTGWFDLLRSLGYSGSLNDMELAFWEAGGTFPP